MSSSSSGLWFAMLAAAAGSGIVVACASSPALEETPQSWNCATAGCSDGGTSGDDAQSPDNTSDDASTPDDSSSGGGDDTGTVESNDTGAPTSEDSGNVATADAGDWVNMTNNADGCHEKPNVPCGYTATNEGQGWTCACREGTQSEGWTCEAPGYPVVAGPSCPGVVSSGDAATPEQDSSTSTGPTDSGGGGADAGWIDMNTSATACDDHPGVPCAWGAAGLSQGYTCKCYNAGAQDPWGCEPASTPTTCDGGI
jgi:hypothetical protein